MEIIDTSRQKPLGGLQQLFLLLVLSYTYYNLAWVTEDAFIIFRSVDQRMDVAGAKRSRACSIPCPCL